MTRDFLGREWTYDCMGCAIANGSMQVPGGLIRQTEHFCVHQDPLIPLPGFLVIGARRHICSLAEMSAGEYHEFAALLRATQSAIHAAISIEGLTIVQEEHSVHFHLWFFPWTAEIIAKYGPPALEKIRAIMAETRQQIVGQDEWAALAASIEKIRVNCSAPHQV
jgi:diadenosine tetraphosphate (Ap4A) HIT family hydrolase